MSWLTAALPGVGGSYKETPADFEVEEIPLYPCSGVGEHLYLWVEKTGISTMELMSRIARGTGLKEDAIGYAGLKDSRALTRQWLSIPVAKRQQLDGLQLDNARILAVEQHGNKLRQGHLAGNRFRICLHTTTAAAAERAAAILDILGQRGVPNLFGEQRYGILGNSGRLGELLLSGSYTAFCEELIGDPELIQHPGWQRAAQAYRRNELAQAVACLPGGMRIEQRLLGDLIKGKSHRAAALGLPRQRLRLYLSAAQSAFFDRLLLDRITAPEQLKHGDIAYKHANGACFRVTAADTEQPRADSFEISPTAPLFGYKVMIAAGEPGRAETALLKSAGLDLNSWKLERGLAMPGERRPLRVPLGQARVSPAPDSRLMLEFSLPKGSYATSVLREVMKSSAEGPAELLLCRQK